MTDLLNSKIISLLSKALDASAFRGSVLSQNIANVNTPDYKRADVNFHEVMSETADNNNLEMARTHPAHIGNLEPISVPPKITLETSTSERLDGNNVDIESEMTYVVENSLYFQAVSQRLTGKFNTLKKVIEGK